MRNVIVLGSGTWGSALANVLAEKGHHTTIWSKFPGEVKELSTTRKHKNLPGEINKDIIFTSDLSQIKGNDIVVFAVPSAFIRETAHSAKEYIKNDQIIVTVAKGLESDTLFTMSEIIKDELGQDKKVVILSGPTHAEEVAIKQPTLIVASNKNEEIAKIVQEVFSTDYLRVYTNNDESGAELCGALKNIIALASGMSHGLGYGDNASAAIITRGLSEITKLGLAMGCDAKTFSGLTGIGDIVVTATSMHSRNFKAGILLGQGKSLDETLKEVGMVVEGIYALDAAYKLGQKYHVELPIIDGIYGVVREGHRADELLDKLFSRKWKNENN